MSPYTLSLLMSCEQARADGFEGLAAALEVLLKRDLAEAGGYFRHA